MKKYISKISILGITFLIFCFSILIIPTQAYFTKVITSVTNVIRTANYALEITVLQSGETLAFENGTALAAGTYTLMLTPKADCAEHGFCVVTVGESIYYTVSIKKGEQLSLTLILDEASKVLLTAHWGEAENYEVVDSGWTLIENGTLAETTTAIIPCEQTEEAASS